MKSSIQTFLDQNLRFTIISNVIWVQTWTFSNELSWNACWIYHFIAKHEVTFYPSGLTNSFNPTLRGKLQNVWHVLPVQKYLHNTLHYPLHFIVKSPACKVTLLFIYHTSSFLHSVHSFWLIFSKRSCDAWVCLFCKCAKHDGANVNHLLLAFSTQP